MEWPKAVLLDYGKEKLRLFSFWVPSVFLSIKCNHSVGVHIVPFVKHFLKCFSYNNKLFWKLLIYVLAYKNLSFVNCKLKSNRKANGQVYGQRNCIFHCFHCVVNWENILRKICYICRKCLLTSLISRGVHHSLVILVMLVMVWWLCVAYKKMLFTVTSFLLALCFDMNLVIR